MSLPLVPARRRAGRRWGLALCFLAVGLLILLPSFRSLMHESDQAALLLGGWSLATGEASPLHADFYNYDRLFFTYWLLAMLIRVARAFTERPDVVLLGNVLS